MDIQEQQSNDLSLKQKKYLEQVIWPLLPNARIGSSFSMAGFDQPFGGSEIKMGSQNDYLYRSPYFYNKKKLEFIHYTSIHNALNILREKQLRMYNLTKMNDPLELDYSINSIDPLHKIHPEIINEWKQTAFCLSMCENKDEEKKGNFNNWQKFGRDGYGVGIVLSFNKTNQKDWFNQYLSKVYYGENFLSRFSEFQERHKNFQIEENFQIKDHIFNIFLNLCCFHKVGIYQNEKEVRLLKIIEKKPYQNHDNKDVNVDFTTHSKLVYFTSLNLDNKEYRKKVDSKFSDIKDANKAYKMQPETTIKKIILGYRINSSEGYDIADVVNRIAQRTLGYKIQVEMTNLKQYF